MSNLIKRFKEDLQLVHIHSGKGAMDRTIPLPKITLLTLRKFPNRKTNQPGI